MKPVIQNRGRQRLARGASLFVIGAFLSASAFGQTPASGPAPEPSRDTVVIVGQTIEETLPQELARYGSDLETVTSEEIRNALQVDVTNALQMSVPGVFVAPQGGAFSYMDISLQGSRSQDILFLVDGVRINNRLYPGTITDTLPSSMVERVELLKGGQSLFYGTNAAAGVINVVTRGYTDEFDGLVTIGADTNEGYRADGYVRGRLGPGNYVLYGSKAQSEGYRLFDGVQPSSTDQNRSYDIQTIGLKYRLALADNLSLDARYQHTDADLDNLRYNRTRHVVNSRDEDVASLAVDYAMNDVVQLLVKGYWHDWDTSYDDYRNSVLPPYTLSVVSDNAYWGYEDKGVNALAKFTPGGPFEYLAGYDYQTYSALDDVWRIEDTTEDVQAFFGQVRSTDDLIENADFAAGVRFDDTGGADSTTWNVSGRYDFTPSLYAQATLGTSFLLPNAEQLFVIEEFWYLGNPGVEPEESQNLNISLGGEFGGGEFGSNARFSWQATYFARTIENLINGVSFAEAGIDTSQPYRGLDISGAAGQYDGVFTNVDGEVEVRGFELRGVADLGSGFAANASYTRSESEMNGSGSQLARIPKDYLKVGGNYRSPTELFGVGVDFIWVGEQVAPAGAFGLQNYGDYSVLDLSAHVFLDADRNHKITARLENALDEDYATRVAAGVRDSGGAILVSTRGVPQTLHLSYSYGF